MNPDSPFTREQAEAFIFDLASLAERHGLDCIQALGSTHEPGTNGGTSMVAFGIGNLYARHGIAQRWVNAIHMELEDMDCPDSGVTVFEGYNDDDSDDFLGNA